MTLAAIAGYDPKDPYTWDVPGAGLRGSTDGGISAV